ncbi:hypothetical protein X975_20820, partial [Stegodyphus mimosarum]
MLDFSSYEPKGLDECKTRHMSSLLLASRKTYLAENKTDFEINFKNVIFCGGVMCLHIKRNGKFKNCPRQQTL